jgi:hypothetical protein
MEDASAEEIEASAAIHGSLQHFQPADLALGWAGCLRQIKRRLHRRLIPSQIDHELLQRCRRSRVEHRIEVLMALAPQKLVQALGGRDAVGKTRYPAQEAGDKGLLSGG